MRLNDRTDKNALSWQFDNFAPWKVRAKMTSLDSISSKGNKSSSRSLALRARLLEL